MHSTKGLILAVKNTLDTVQVQGVDNMRKMVMCCDALEHLAKTLESNPTELEGNEKEDTQNG